MSPDQAFVMACAVEQLLAKACTFVPGLAAGDIDLLGAILERVLRAIWHAHGNGIAEHLGMLGLGTPAPPGSASTFDVDDPDLPF
jgi:hypothetical protein